MCHLKVSNWSWGSFIIRHPNIWPPKWISPLATAIGELGMIGPNNGPPESDLIASIHFAAYFVDWTNLTHESQQLILAGKIQLIQLLVLEWTRQLVLEAEMSTGKKYITKCERNFAFNYMIDELSEAIAKYKNKREEWGPWKAIAFTPNERDKRDQKWFLLSKIKHGEKDESTIASTSRLDEFWDSQLLNRITLLSKIHEVRNTLYTEAKECPNVFHLRVISRLPGPPSSFLFLSLAIASLRSSSFI